MRYVDVDSLPTRAAELAELRAKKEAAGHQVDALFDLPRIEELRTGAEQIWDPSARNAARQEAGPAIQAHVMAGLAGVTNLPNGFELVDRLGNGERLHLDTDTGELRRVVGGRPLRDMELLGPEAWSEHCSLILSGLREHLTGLAAVGARDFSLEPIPGPVPH